MSFFRRAVTALAWLYPAVLLALILAMRFVGERWWVTGVALYLPRIGFALPLPVLALAIAVARRPHLWWTQLAAALLLVFPIMGLVLPWVHRGAGDAPVIRVLSYNVNSGAGGVDAVLQEIDRYAPDVVLLQEVGSENALGKALAERYPTVSTANQFLIATRFPILSTTNPEKLEDEGRWRSPRYLRQVLDTPIGRIALYHVHPISPREAFYQIRGTVSKRRFFLDRLFESANNARFEANSGLRALQVHTFATDAEREKDPVIIAGDTNLPGLSYILHRDLSGYADGFSRAGWGFGYTFPTRRPWMRIDRVLASSELRFVRFEVGTSRASDHHCVVAELQRRDE